MSATERRAQPIRRLHQPWASADEECAMDWLVRKRRFRCVRQRLGRQYNLAFMNTPAGAGEPVIYLDFDGVLHPENVVFPPTKGPTLLAPPPHRMFQHVALLEQELAPFPDIMLVLSTSWVVRRGYAKTAKKLPATLRARVIGATYHSRMDKQLFLSSPRGMQVSSDVLRRKPRDWLALDDDYLHLPA